jgi:hypothetical protein
MDWLPTAVTLCPLEFSVRAARAGVTQHLERIVGAGHLARQVRSQQQAQALSGGSGRARVENRAQRPVERDQHMIGRVEQGCDVVTHGSPLARGVRQITPRW